MTLNGHRALGEHCPVENAHGRASRTSSYPRSKTAAFSHQNRTACRRYRSNRPAAASCNGSPSRAARYRSRPPGEGPPGRCARPRAPRPGWPATSARRRLRPPGIRSPSPRRAGRRRATANRTGSADRARLSPVPPRRPRRAPKRAACASCRHRIPRRRPAAGSDRLASASPARAAPCPAPGREPAASVDEQIAPPERAEELPDRQDPDAVDETAGGLAADHDPLP